MVGRLTQLREDLLERIRDADPVDRWAQGVENALEQEPFQRDEEFLARLLRLMKFWNAWFDAEVRGFERVPDGAVLLVGNHSGGTLTPDTSALWAHWYEYFGMDRPLVGLAFDAAFSVPGLRDILRKMGEVPANMENAGRALSAGASVIVYPAGDYDVYRPWTERNQIDFNGRKGFIRLALKQQVPVVPVVGHGGHETLIVLTRGDKLAKRLGLDRLRMEVAPIAWGLPWGIYPGGVPYIPLPAKVTVEVCEPMDWSAYGPEDADDPIVLERCYEEITEAMQQRLTALAEENPWPLASRLRALFSGARKGPADAGQGGRTMSDPKNLPDVVADIVEQGANAAEEIHRSIANFPLDVIERADVVGDVLSEVRRIQNKGIGAVYDLVRGINKEVNKLTHELTDAPAPKKAARPRAAA